jgi:trehalose 6-phosphate phosphatase
MAQDIVSPTDDRPEIRNRPSALPTPGAGWALFLDVDGTLVELAAEPDSVRVDARLIALLDALRAKLGGAVALVSGRTIGTLDRLFAPLALPAAGNHGLERRDCDGRIRRSGAAPAMAEIGAAMRRFAGDHPGVIVEDKMLSVALHYRNRPQAAKPAAELAQRLVTRHDGDLIVQNGKMMVEVRPGCADKGTAIADFLDETPFAGRVPVFVGDDVTDETGFALVNTRSGYAIRVGDEPQTVARYRVPDVVGVIDWLEGVVAASD